MPHYAAYLCKAVRDGAAQRAVADVRQRPRVRLHERLHVGQVHAAARQLLNAALLLLRCHRSSVSSLFLKSLPAVLRRDLVRVRTGVLATGSVSHAWREHARRGHARALRCLLHALLLFGAGNTVLRCQVSLHWCAPGLII